MYKCVWHSVLFGIVKIDIKVWIDGFTFDSKLWCDLLTYNEPYTKHHAQCIRYEIWVSFMRWALDMSKLYCRSWKLDHISKMFQIKKNKIKIQIFLMLWPIKMMWPLNNFRIYLQTRTFYHRFEQMTHSTNSQHYHRPTIAIDTYAEYLCSWMNLRHFFHLFIWSHFILPHESSFL